MNAPQTITSEFISKSFSISIDVADDAVVQKLGAVCGPKEVQVIEFRIRHSEFSDDIAQFTGQFVDVLDGGHPVVIGVVQENRGGDGLQVVVGRRERSVGQEVLRESEIEHSELGRVDSLCIVDQLVNRRSWNQKSSWDRMSVEKFH